MKKLKLSILALGAVLLMCSPAAAVVMEHCKVISVGTNIANADASVHRSQHVIILDDVTDSDFTGNRWYYFHDELSEGALAAALTAQSTGKELKVGVASKVAGSLLTFALTSNVDLP